MDVWYVCTVNRSQAPPCLCELSSAIITHIAQKQRQMCGCEWCGMKCGRLTSQHDYRRKTVESNNFILNTSRNWWTCWWSSLGKCTHGASSLLWSDKSSMRLRSTYLNGSFAIMDNIFQHAIPAKHPVSCICCLAICQQPFLRLSIRKQLEHFYGHHAITLFYVSLYYTQVSQAPDGTLVIICPG